MSRWVSTEIVTADTAQHRAMLIKRFVLIASVSIIVMKVLFFFSRFCFLDMYAIK